MALAALPAPAADACEPPLSPHDVVKKAGDLLIEKGQRADDAIALEGNVRLAPSAKVKRAIALHGDVVLAPGAEVTELALAINGKVELASGAKAKGSLEVSPAGTRARGEAGKVVDTALSIGGPVLGSQLVEQVLARLKACKVLPAE